MFDSLEPRRLFVSGGFAHDNASYKDGVLRINGTDGSDKIIVNTYYIVNIGANNKPRGTPEFRVNVDFNGTGIANYTCADVRRINVYGNGGNDRILGADNVTRVVIDPGWGKMSNGYVALSDGKTVTLGKSQVAGRPASPIKTIAAQAVPPLYVEGGKGNDTIHGGAGNDTLLGGAGDDRITDSLGRNTTDGGSGSNAVSSLRVVRGAVSGHAVLDDGDDDTLV